MEVAAVEVSTEPLIDTERQIEDVRHAAHELETRGVSPPAVPPSVTEVQPTRCKVALMAERFGGSTEGIHTQEEDCAQPSSVELQHLTTPTSSGHASAADSGSDSPRPLVLHPRQRSAEEAQCDEETVRLARKLPDRKFSLSLVPPEFMPLHYLGEIVFQEHSGGMKCSDEDTETDSSPTTTHSTMKHLSESIRRKRELLLKDKADVEAEIGVNARLGERVRQVVCERCGEKGSALRKLDQLLGQLDTALKLLCLLSSKLARVDNELSQIEEEDPKQEGIHSKRQDVEKRLEEAKLLKAGVDSRQETVSSALRGYLTSSEFDDYLLFMRQKSALHIQRQEIEEAVNNADERLSALTDRLQESTY